MEGLMTADSMDEAHNPMESVWDEVTWRRNGPNGHDDDVDMAAGNSKETSCPPPSQHLIS